ncbi:MAG: amino acid ABC transporter permease [Cyanobacteria bacterium P01_H01_bin.58]
MNLDFGVVFEHFGKFLEGIWNTVWLSGVGMVFGLLFGTLLLIPLIRRNSRFYTPVRMFVDLSRAVPFLMLAYLMYYGLPSLGITLNSWITAVLSIVIYNTSYIAEILRSAWLSIPTGQIESAQAFGFSGFRLFQRIIFPQVLLAAGPTLGNQSIQIVKDSAFLSIITIPELTYAARAIQSRYLVAFESFILAALLYWGLCFLIEVGVNRMEKMRDAYVQY